MVEIALGVLAEQGGSAKRGRGLSVLPRLPRGRRLASTYLIFLAGITRVAGVTRITGEFESSFFGGVGCSEGAEMRKAPSLKLV